MSESKPSFKRVLDRESGEDFFDWHPRMSAENFIVIEDEIGRRDLEGVQTRADLASRWPALERFIAETQDGCSRRVLRPLFTPHDSLELSPHFDGLHVWLISLPEASSEELQMLSNRTEYDAGYAHWPTLWELKSRATFGFDALPLDVYDLETGRLQDASACGAVLVVYVSRSHAVLTPMLSGIFDLTSELINYKPFRRFELSELQMSTQREREAILSPDVLTVWPRPVSHKTIGYESPRRTFREARVGRMDAVATLPQPSFSGRSERFLLLAGPAKDLALFQDRLSSVHWMVLWVRGRPAGAVLCVEDTKPSIVVASLAFAPGDVPEPATLQRLLGDTKLAYEDCRTGQVTELAFPGALRVQHCSYEPRSDGSEPPDIDKVDSDMRSYYVGEFVEHYLRDDCGLAVTSFATGDWPGGAD